MPDPDTISADYTLRPSELAATLKVLVEARQPVMVWGGPGMRQERGRAAGRGRRRPALTTTCARCTSSSRGRWGTDFRPGLRAPLGAGNPAGRVPSISRTWIATATPDAEPSYDVLKARAVYKPEDIAIAGCIVTVGSNGALQVVHGLVKPEDIPADTDATSGAASHEGGEQDGGQQTASGIQSPSASGPAMPPARPDPEAEARKVAGVGIGLADDLRAVRTALVKAHLAEDFGAAFDLMLFQMGPRGVHPRLSRPLRWTSRGARDPGPSAAPRQRRHVPRVEPPARPCWKIAPRSASTGWRVEERRGILRRAEGTCP